MSDCELVSEIEADREVESSVVTDSVGEWESVTVSESERVCVGEGVAVLLAVLECDFVGEGVDVKE